MRQDFWFALRRLRARPLHTVTVLTILAIGTGAALSVFRVADAVLLRALPYANAGRLQRISMHLSVAPARELPFSDVGYRAQEHRNRAFDVIASYRVAGVNLTVHGVAERVASARVTGNFFDVLGLPVQVGRSFHAGEDSLKGPTLLILSDALWRRRFGADRNVAGTVVRIDGAPATVIGVADPRLAFPAAGIGYWTLMDLDANGTAPFELGIEAVGRLRRGMSTAAATAEATRVIQEVARENPGPHSAPGADVSGDYAILRPIRDDMAGGVKPTLALLTVAVLFVLLLTCVNVATLELVRSNERVSELAIRSALGADRRRLITGALFEGGLQAAAGGLLGLLLSAVTVRALRNLMPAAFGADDGVHMSIGLAAATLTVIALGAIASGAFPIAVTSRADVQSFLRERRGVNTRRFTVVRRGLIVAQLAVACILVDGAALMLTSVRAAQRVSLGFRPEGLVLFRLSLPSETFPAPADVSTAFAALTDKLRGVAGVAKVALASTVPLDAEAQAALVGIEGRPFHADGTDPSVDLRVVSAGYFDVLGIGLVAGTGFAEGDTYPGGTPVVISQSAAALLWPGGDDPIGHRVRIGPYAPWMVITGVVTDAKNRSLTLPSTPEMYLPFGAARSPVRTSRDMAIVVRSAAAGDQIQAAVQRAVSQFNSDLPVYGMRRLDDVVRSSQTREVVTMQTLTGFAAVALLLAIAGSYAVLMFAVVQRRHEMALRKAVGATTTNLVAMIAGEMALLLAVGVTAGVTGMALMSRFLARFLFGITALDMRVTLATLAVIGVAGLGAALLPARRAGAIDPMLALRGE